MSWENEIKEIEKRKRLALLQGGESATENNTLKGGSQFESELLNWSILIALRKSALLLGQRVEMNPAN